jgi:hypothetical protein
MHVMLLTSSFMAGKPDGALLSARPAEWRSKNASSSANAKMRAPDHHTCDLEPPQ